MSTARELLERSLDFIDPSNYEMELHQNQAALLYDNIQEYLSQPEPEPVDYQFQDRDGKWCWFLSRLQYDETVKDGSYPIRALYAEQPDQSARIAELEHQKTSLHKSTAEAWKDFSNLEKQFFAQRTLLSDAQEQIRQLEHEVYVSNRDYVAMKAKLDGGVRVYTSYDVDEEDGGRFVCYNNNDNWKPNATLILDKVAKIGKVGE